MCFSPDWLPYIIGAFTQLTMNTTWVGTDDEIQNARQQANNLIVLFQMAAQQCFTNPAGQAGAGDDFMIRQNPDNPCELQSSVDGTNWCTWADLSKCLGQPPQPGKTAPNPSAGQCADYEGLVNFGSRWLLPKQVSTGDTIEVTNAVGTWASALDLFIPRCPDGNIFFEVACVEGTGHTEPGDPAPTINHDSLIGFDGTHYYDFGPASNNMPVTVTIPSGISNANFYFFANTPDTSGFGSVVFNVHLCNNAAVRYTHVFDFTRGLQGWTINVFGGLPQGALELGLGIVGSDFIVSGSHVRGVNIERVGPAASFDTLVVNFDFTPGDQSGGVGEPCQFYGIPSSAVINNIVGSSINGTNQFITEHGAHTGVTDMNLYFWTDDTSGSPSGVVHIISITISGTGPDPF